MMVDEIQFPELVLASYTKNPSAPYDPDGLVQVWNMHLHSRPEYIFHAQVCVTLEARNIDDVLLTNSRVMCLRHVFHLSILT
jgi:hypothetical protein